MSINVGKEVAALQRMTVPTARATSGGSNPKGRRTKMRAGRAPTPNSGRSKTISRTLASTSTKR